MTMTSEIRSQATPARDELAEAIPYDEMRRLCGLPDVRAYVAKRELARVGEQFVEVFQRVAKEWVNMAQQVLPQLQAITEASKPKQAAPMWANDPAHTRRTAFGPTKRVK